MLIFLEWRAHCLELHARGVSYAAQLVGSFVPVRSRDRLDRYSRLHLDVGPRSRRRECANRAGRSGASASSSLRLLRVGSLPERQVLQYQSSGEYEGGRTPSATTSWLRRLMTAREARSPPSSGRIPCRASGAPVSAENRAEEGLASQVPGLPVGLQPLRYRLACRSLRHKIRIVRCYRRPGNPRRPR